MKPSKPHLSILWLFGMGLLGPAIGCERDQPAESPQPTTSAQAYNPQPPPGAYPPPTATAYAQPTATTAAAPTAAPPPTAPATATAAAPTATAALPSFPTTLPVPNFQFPSPQILTQILPTVPLDPKLLQQLQQAGQELLQRGTMLLGDPTDAGLKAAAVKYAPLMVAEGAPYKDTLMANSHKAFDVTLQGGKCYTIIAYSPPGQITNIDLHLLVPPFYNMDAGHDDTNDSTAVIGKGQAPLCPFTLIPIPYRVDVFAKAGQGQVAVQVYSKSK